MDTSTLPPDSLLGATLGGYVVQRRIGQGGVGVVYLARQPEISKTVAIKVLSAEAASDPEHLERLVDEARAVSAIKHRAIIDVFGFGKTPQGQQYLVMEYLEGAPLDAYLIEKHHLPASEVVAILDEVLAAVGAAHKAGVVHRDLKPGNVFLALQSDGTRQVKVLDFGLAKRLETPDGWARQTGLRAAGTPAYIAPEQARGESVGPASDLYAIGAMAFEMLTGDIPFPDPSPMAMLMKHISAPVPRVKRIRPEIPASLDAWVFQLMAKDPADRPVSADAVRQQLLAAELGRKSVGKRARPLLWGLTALVLLAAASAAVAVRSQEPREVVPTPAPDPSGQQLLAEGEAAYRDNDFARAVDTLGRASRIAEPPPGAAEALRRAEAARRATGSGMVRVGDFWIDQYEYPNVPGQPPKGNVDFTEASGACESTGKRLCTESEWQRACEGQARRAYPYGASYQPGTCVTSRKAPARIGSATKCVSEEGAFDMSGNLAEWTASPVQPGAPQRVIRGGTFRQSGANVSCAGRDYLMPGQGGMPWVGFRCCFAVSGR